ncbi:MAG: phosphopentomutase [Ruminococcaceae bacterium]|nr:phosphopentomutase [Oscillospiraceae bacterium]
MSKRVFLIVLDSFGIGEMPDAENYGDKGSDTLGSVFKSPEFNMPNMKKLGLFNIEGVSCGKPVENPLSAVARMSELSKGKDTTVGHWELAGLVSQYPMPTYPDGFPEEIIQKFSEATGRRVLCNKPYSGTVVIEEYGKRHMESGDLIVYTSADSVFQIAAHEEIVPPEKLYEYCKIARNILQGEHGVGRVIARPFVGEPGYFTRTTNRKDFSLEPTGETMLDRLSAKGMDVIAVGKIHDIFAGRGITEKVYSKTNKEGMDRTMELVKKDFKGLCFVNLVEFDSMYGHRNDVDGYAKALWEFDVWLGDFLPELKEEDMLIIAADHGCDPATESTDHSREYVPFIAYGKNIKPVNYGTVKGFNFVAEKVCDYLDKQTY